MFNPFRPFFNRPSPLSDEPARGKCLVRFIHIDGNVYFLSATSPTGVDFFTEDDNVFRPCPEDHTSGNGVSVLQIAIALAMINGIITIGGRSEHRIFPHIPIGLN